MCLPLALYLSHKVDSLERISIKLRSKSVGFGFELKRELYTKSKEWSGMQCWEMRAK